MKNLLFYITIAVGLTCFSCQKSKADTTTSDSPQYNSYDLAFFHLKGKVKSFSQDYKDWNNYPYLGIIMDNPVHFDENGNWINRPSEFVKDSDGKIIRWDGEIMDGDGPTYITWENGRLEDDFSPERVYSKEGWFLMESYYTPNETPLIKIYTDYLVDSQGNWIQRKVNRFEILTYWYTPSYELIDGYENKIRKISEEDVEIQNRNIIYYTDVQNEKKPNEESQIQLLKTLKEMSTKDKVPLEEYENLLKKYNINF